MHKIPSLRRHFFIIKVLSIIYYLKNNKFFKVFAKFRSCLKIHIHNESYICNKMQGLNLEKM